MKRFAAETRITRAPEFKASIHQMNIGPLSKRVVNDSFVLIDSDRTSRIDQVPARFRSRIDAVNGTQNELLLQMR